MGDGDFEDILAADNPEIWHSHRPTEGDVAGKMLADIIARAAKLKAQGAAPKEKKSRAAGSAPRPKRAKRPVAWHRS